MRKLLITMGILTFLSSCFVGKSRKTDTATAVTPPESIYNISIKNLDGTDEIKLSDYKGKYIVIANTASECGYTYQYKDLQEFYEKYKDKNVVVLGCPCNQFGGQEPGTVSEIGVFCQKNYGVNFPLTDKIDVKGSAQHPLYQWLTKKEKNGAGDFEVKWNFNKFIIDPQGNLIQYFSSNVKPGDKEFLDIFKSQK